MSESNIPLVGQPTRTAGYTRYIVTKSSDDGTFEEGDHIIFNDNGSISCIEAMGWIDADDVADASIGMEITPDMEWIKKKKARQMMHLLGDEMKPLTEQQAIGIANGEVREVGEAVSGNAVIAFVKAVEAKHGI